MKNSKSTAGMGGSVNQQKGPPMLTTGGEMVQCPGDIEGTLNHCVIK